MIQLSKINSTKTNVVGTHKNRFNETVLLSTKTNAKTEWQEITHQYVFIWRPDRLNET